MRKLMIGTLIVAAFALVGYSRAQAEPPPQGSYVTIQQPMIGCDSREQIEQIAKAQLESTEAAQAKYDELHAIKDKDGEATCMFGRLATAVAVGESIPLPDLKFGDIEVKAWALHLGTERGDWYALFIAPKVVLKDTSI